LHHFCYCAGRVELLGRPSSCFLHRFWQLRRGFFQRVVLALRTFIGQKTPAFPPYEVWILDGSFAVFFPGAPFPFHLKILRALSTGFSDWSQPRFSFFSSPSYGHGHFAPFVPTSICKRPTVLVHFRAASPASIQILPPQIILHQRYFRPVDNLP